jgi:hypothetical protein
MSPAGSDSAGTPFTGRTLPPGGFAGDDGRPDPSLLAALGRWRDAPGTEPDVVAALAAARLFVAVVALPGEQTQMALVTVTGTDGRKALPVFSSPEALGRWRGDARPVPVPGPRAALSAVAEGCDLLDLDPAGPVSYLVRRPAVWCLGRGVTWTPSYADPVVAQEISSLCMREGISGECRRGTSAELRVVVRAASGLGPDAVAALVARLEQALSHSELVAERVDSLEVTLLPAG